MDSLSILSLNADCLCSILSYLIDFSSFYSFSLTCKRFNQLAGSERNCHINVLKRKAEFYTRQFVVYKCEHRRYEGRRELISLLEGAEQCSIDQVSFNRILDVWKSCGPVAAKYFSWLKSSSSVRREEGPRETCSTKYDTQTFHLPKCDQDLSIITSHFVDYIWNYDRETNFKISCGDLEIKNEVSRIIPEDYHYWDEEEMRAVVEPMKPVIDLLQNELGDTVPPITDKFFVWMCFRYLRLEEEQRIYFKDEAKNAKPTMESLQPVLELYRQNKSRNMRKPIEKWLNGKEESHSARAIARAVEILVQKSRTAILRQLREDVERFSVVGFDYDLKKAPKKMMLDLVNRTTLFLGNYSSAAVADKYVGNKAHFRMKGGSLLKIDGGIQGDGASYPSWFALSMNFCLPDGSKIEIQSPDFMYTSLTRDHSKALTSKFSPITEILQECINESMKNENEIPRIENIFTVYYFLQVMQFSGVKHFFEGVKQTLFKADVNISDSECSE